MCLYSWDYTIIHNENEDENKNTSHRYDINRPRPRHGRMMIICIKQHLSNIWSSIYEKVKQHWGLGWKKRWS